MEKTVTLEYERETKRMIRFKNAETGVIYLPKDWFDKVPETAELTVKA